LPEAQSRGAATECKAIFRVPRYRSLSEQDVVRSTGRYFAGQKSSRGAATERSEYPLNDFERFFYIINVMQHFVYVLENQTDKSWYIGFTVDLEKRIAQHNRHTGGEYTKKRDSAWKLIYCEMYLDKKDATRREKFLKGGSGRTFLKKQLSYYLLS